MGFKSAYCSLFLCVLINLSGSHLYDGMDSCYFDILDALITKSANFTCNCDWIDRQDEIFGNPTKLKAFARFHLFKEKEFEFDRRIVDELHLKECRFSTLNQGFFETFHNLHTVSIPKVELETLHVNTFRGARKLTKLDISKNKLKEIPSHIFFEAVKLKDVDFSENYIIRVHPLAFEGAMELQKVNLSLNQLSDIDAHSFTLPKLMILDLSNNNITKLNENFFNKLTNLKILNLSFNELTHLHTTTFANLFDLEELGLRHTNLSNILPDTFLHQSKLIALDLSENSLKKFDYNLFDPIRLNLHDLRLGRNQLSDLNGLENIFFPKMNILDIQGNPFNCSYLQQMIESFSKQLENVHFHCDTSLIDVHKSYIRGVNCNLSTQEKTINATQSTLSIAV